jgi:hypothetical protein
VQELFGIELMNIRAKSQIILFIALILSVVSYLLNIYPSFIKNIGKDLSLEFILFIYISLLFSYFAFFIWPHMRTLFFVGLSFFLIIFFNLFLIVTAFSSYAALGIIVMLIFLVGLLLVGRTNGLRERR